MRRHRGRHPRGGKAPSAPGAGREPTAGGKTEGGTDLLGRWWMQGLVSAWMLFVVVTYFWLQLSRLLEIGAPKK